MTILWLIMPPSGLVIRLASTCGDGILPGTIAVMAGMEAGTTHGIHLIIMAVGAMAGMIPGIMVGTILGIMATMVIHIIMVGVILTGEAITSQVVVGGMPIITTSVRVLFVLMVPLMPIVMETLCQVVAVVRPVFATVPVG